MIRLLIAPEKLRFRRCKSLELSIPRENAMLTHWWRRLFRSTASVYQRGKKTSTKISGTEKFFSARLTQTSRSTPKTTRNRPIISISHNEQIIKTTHKGGRTGKIGKTGFRTNNHIEGCPSARFAAVSAVSASFARWRCSRPGISMAERCAGRTRPSVGRVGGQDRRSLPQRPKPQALPFSRRRRRAKHAARRSSGREAGIV